MRVLVGLSGGVDSSVAALILKEQGHKVIGATMSIWGKQGLATAEGKHNACYGPDEVEDIETARKFCEKFGFEYHVVDCVTKYEDIVLKNFKKEYLDGHTPNPCVWCNALIKFGVLPEVAKSLKEVIVFIINIAAGTPLSDTSPIKMATWSSSMFT